MPRATIQGSNPNQTVVIRAGGQYLHTRRFGWWVDDPKDAARFSRCEAEKIVREEGPHGWSIEVAP